MIEQVYWYTRGQADLAPPLAGNIEADAVVIGGGVAGLAAAQWLREEAGLDVVLLEAHFCGAGATGKSSGFITPDSELELHQLARRFGDADAKFLWDSACSGVEQIRHNIDRLAIACDRLQADSLYVANSRSSVSSIRTEHDTHQRLGFPSRFYEESELPPVIGTSTYHAALRTYDTFSINGYLYAQGLKHALMKQGVRVFENSAAVEIAPHGAQTAHGTVHARLVLICLDRYAPNLALTPTDNYHAQTFLILSEPLDETTRRRIFPEQPLLVWDTDLVYQYFRPTADHRLLVGGSQLRYTYRRHKSHGENSAVHALVHYAREKFPFLSETRFTHYWPGMIGVTKDLLPLAGRSAQVPSHFYAMCSAGLPWSTLAGRVAAQQAVEGTTPLDQFFAPSRAFNPLEPLQPLLRKPATFAVSHYYSKNFEKGHADQIARQQRYVRAGLWVTAGITVGLLAGMLIKKGRRTKQPERQTLRKRKGPSTFRRRAYSQLKPG